MEKTSEQKLILAAIHRCIIGIGKVKKEGKNPRFDSTYATLEQILDVVNPFVFSEGLAMSQKPGFSDGCATMVLTFIDPNGNDLDYAFSAVPIGKIYPKNADPQEPNAQTAIAAQTYLARTQIAHVFRLNLTDDDGNEATGWKPEQKYHDRAGVNGHPDEQPNPRQSRPAPSAAKAREGKGWDEPAEEGSYKFKGRTWEFKLMNCKQLGTVAYSADEAGMSQYPPDFIKKCNAELLKRVAAGEQDAIEMVEVNS